MLHQRPPIKPTRFRHAPSQYVYMLFWLLNWLLGLFARLLQASHVLDGVLQCGGGIVHVSV